MSKRTSLQPDEVSLVKSWIGYYLRTLQGLILDLRISEISVSNNEIRVTGEFTRTFHDPLTKFEAKLERGTYKLIELRM